ncbi:cuticle protein 64-like [Diorhabda carinulata]|uniref:cuticle protein 64-like n=1 Tax=Diorhabda carinulata TaxID=1163345 RepID=UPI0025A0576F|nr:cuticle protein 64-like [Diorhabda carinulata]
MYKLLIFTTIFALCSARPSNIGYTYSLPSVSTFAAPVAAVSPTVSVNSGISTQSRVDYRTPSFVAAPALATSVAVPALATSSVGFGYGGVPGYGNNGGYGLNAIGYGIGYGH